jgi:hypothetical protein
MQNSLLQSHSSQNSQSEFSSSHKKSTTSFMPYSEYSTPRPPVTPPKPALKSVEKQSKVESKEEIKREIAEVVRVNL